MSPSKPSNKSLFIEAIEIESEAEREAFLQQACGDNDQLREEIESLLDAHGAPAEVVKRIDNALPTIDRSITEQAGTVIGRYKLREQIGEGGFGVVYVAEQREPVSRKVALKIVKPGMDTKGIIARFEAEQQALAMMDHPNIAKVLDGGATQTGRPYFAMELVHGVTITEFSDDQKLSTQQRLLLFVDVCRAVHHAHQKGVIHRDIKPSNIMVTMHDDKPVPKVIDFGVAKALSQKLTENTVYTAYDQMIGTPIYMSPEQTQMSGLDVDTRSDIYSLGVLLYELLTGTTPFDKERLQSAEFDEMRRMIREDEPPRPSDRISTLNAALLSTVSASRKIDPRKMPQSYRGELDWIVMKALEKDRRRRYETANDFAADIQRYLSGEQVLACPPSAAYRFKKFAQRNRRMLATSVLLVATLVCGMVGTVWQAVRANQEREYAQTARNFAEDRLQRALQAEKAANDSRLVAEQAKELEADLRQQAEDERQQVARLLASSYVDRAQALCEQGEIGRGMLWFAHSLRSSPDDAKDLKRVIRTNLATWHRRMPTLQAVLQHSGQVSSLHYSADGTRAVTAMGVFTVKETTQATTQTWDTATWEPVGNPRHYEGIMRVVAYTDRGLRVATQKNRGEIQVWDGTTGKPIGQPLEHPGGPVWAVAFSSDGSCVLTGSADGTARLWETETGDPLTEFLTHSGRVMAVDISPDGSRLITGVESGAVWLWDAARGERIGEPLQSTRSLKVVAFSPDGSRIAAAGGDVIQLWHAQTRKLACPPMLHGAMVHSLAFGSDGSRIASGGNERAARIWDASNGLPLGVPMRHRGTVYEVAFSPDGSHLLTGCEDGTARLWDVPTGDAQGEQLVHKGNTVLGAAYGPDGLYVATRESGARQLRKHRSGHLLGAPLPDRTQRGTRMRIAPGRARVLLQGTFGEELRDIATGELVEQSFPSESFHAAIFSPDGSRTLAGYGGSRNVAQLRDAMTGESLGGLLKHDDSVRCIAFNADGSRILTGDFAGTTRMWDAATLQPLSEPLRHPSEVKALAWSPDGKRMLTGFADWTVRLWNLASMEPIGEPLHHQNIVCSLAFSPTGSRFVSCSLDQTLRFWDTSTLKPIGPPLRHSSRWPDVSFRSDGMQILVADESGNNQLFPAPPGHVEGDRKRIILWVQVITGLQLDQDGGIGVLDGSTWQDLSRQLRELGESPSTAAISPPPIVVETDFSRAMSLARAGLRHGEQEEWDESVARFTEAIELSQQSPTLQSQIAAWCGLLAAREHDTDEQPEQLLRYTVELYRGLADHISNVSDYREKLSCSYLRLSQKLRQSGRFDEALEADHQVLQLHPSTWKDRVNEAQRYVNGGIHQKRNFGRVLEAEERFTIASFLLQTVMDEIADQAQFRWQLADCYVAIGRIRAAQGHGHEALSAYQRALAMTPESAWAHTYLAELLLASPNQDIRNEDQALIHAKRAAEKLKTRNKSHHYVSWALGRTYYRTGDFAAAIEELQTKGPLTPFSTSRQELFLALAYGRLGDRQAALRHHRRAAELAENYAIADEEYRQLIAEAAESLLQKTETPDESTSPTN